eukprot:686439-Pyramimonas_sp.AAC.1
MGSSTGVYPSSSFSSVISSSPTMKYPLGHSTVFAAMRAICNPNQSIPTSLISNATTNGGATTAPSTHNSTRRCATHARCGDKMG